MALVGAVAGTEQRNRGREGGTELILGLTSPDAAEVTPLGFSQRRPRVLKEQHLTCWGIRDSTSHGDSAGKWEKLWELEAFGALNRLWLMPSVPPHPEARGAAGNSREVVGTLTAWGCCSSLCECPALPSLLCRLCPVLVSGIKGVVSEQSQSRAVQEPRHGVGS